MKDLVVGLKIAREIGNSAALRPFTRREVLPGGLHGIFWHQCGTAKMGRNHMSVVDGSLKVYGMEGLRIADASVLPWQHDGALRSNR